MLLDASEQIVKFVFYTAPRTIFVWSAAIVLIACLSAALGPLGFFLAAFLLYKLSGR